MTKQPSRIQQKNRETILSAALDVFSQFGFRGARLDQIATASGMSKPNLLYYFPSKEAIHAQVLGSLLDLWLDPLRDMNASGDPISEILKYAQRKLDLSRDYPRESRLFANEVLQGAPHLAETLPALKTLVDEKTKIIRTWSNSGQIASIDPYHLIFLIWAQTQHYADFEAQVRVVLDGHDPYPEAAIFIDHMLRRVLTP
jgi:TetR/AcrR family transcriptional regulator